MKPWELKMIREKQYNHKEELKAAGEENAVAELPVGLLSEYADPEKRLLEEGAFERAMVEKHGNG